MWFSLLLSCCFTKQYHFISRRVLISAISLNISPASLLPLMFLLATRTPGSCKREKNKNPPVSVKAGKLIQILSSISLRWCKSFWALCFSPTVIKACTNDWSKVTETQALYKGSSRVSTIPPKHLPTAARGNSATDPRLVATEWFTGLVLWIQAKTFGPWKDSLTGCDGLEIRKRQLLILQAIFIIFTCSRELSIPASFPQSSLKIF